jgi:hypothetical protein
MKYWEIIAGEFQQNRLEFGAASRPWILAGARSGLLTHIATTESVS